MGEVVEVVSFSTAGAVVPGDRGANTRRFAKTSAVIESEAFFASFAGCQGRALIAPLDKALHRGIGNAEAYRDLESIWAGWRIDFALSVDEVIAKLAFLATIWGGDQALFAIGVGGAAGWLANSLGSQSVPIKAFGAAVCFGVAPSAEVRVADSHVALVEGGQGVFL